MKLTKDFIELQDFELIAHTPPHIFVFFMRSINEYNTVTWDKHNNTVTVLLTNEEYEENPRHNETIFKNIITIFDFIKLLIVADKLTNKRIVLPDDFVQQFMKSKYKYNEKEFEDMCEASMIMLLAHENYEQCSLFLEFRKNYMIKRKWIYKDMLEVNFRDYSKITSHFE